MYRNWKCFGLADWPQHGLNSIPEAQRASLCNECGECEKKCPNTLGIREMLRELRSATPS
ncbi:MAG: 4Fe-4S dicluster domain-containing protein [Kiritimatiellia bacterium]